MSCSLSFRLYREWQTVTAGKFKRSLTPFREVTPEDYAKVKDDLESVLTMFKKFVREHRPRLDVAAVATGEVWFGTDAVARGLCDEIGTADDVVLDYVDRGWEVYEVEYRPKRRSLAQRWGIDSADGVSPASSSGEEEEGTWRRSLRRLIRAVISETKSALVAESEQIAQHSMPNLGPTYMAHYDRTGSVRTDTKHSR